MADEVAGADKVAGADEDAAAGRGVRWDCSAMRQQASDVAQARSVADRIVLSFGVRQGDDTPGREQRVALTRRIALDPMTAKQLHEMLARLIAEVGRSQRSPG